MIKHLKNTPKVTKLALWGRSMGAVTGLLYMEKDFSLFKGLVLDSPFSNLAKLAEDVAISKTKLPSLVIKGAMALIKQSIYKKIKLNMAFLALEPLVQRIHNPPLALFAASKTDTFVKFWHIETLYKAYKGEKRLIHLQGDHNEARRPEFLSEVGDFLLKAFNLNKKPQNIEQNKENSPFAMNSIPIIPLASKNPEGHKVPLAQIDLNIESIEGNFMETFSKSLKNLNENDFLHFFTTETENEPRSRAITHDGKLESKEMAPITPLKAEIEVKEPNYEVPNERAERSISALNDYSMFYAKPGLSSLNNDIEGYFSTSYKGNNNENTTEGSTGLKNASIDESILEDEGSPGLEKRYRLMKPKAKAVVKSFNFEKGELKGKRSNKPGNSGLKKGMKVIGEF